jgi:hypothetical protein
VDKNREAIQEVRDSIMSEVRKSAYSSSKSKDQAQGIDLEAVDYRIKSLMEENFQNLKSVLEETNRQAEENIEELKKEFAVALNEAEDSSFKMNEKMIDSIINKIQALEKSLVSLSEQKGGKPSNASAYNSRELASVSADIEQLKQATSALKQEFSSNMDSVHSQLKAELLELTADLQNEQSNLSMRLDALACELRQSGLEARVAAVEEKLCILDRTKKASADDKGKNTLLSCFLSPAEDQLNSNRSLNGNQEKKNSALDKKKVPTINLHSLMVSNTDRTENVLRSRELPPSKPDDSYTSFEEEFKFRLGKTKPGTKEEGCGRLEDIKLSYVFSSASKEGKDNINLESEALSRRLFDEDARNFTDRDLVFMKPKEHITDYVIKGTKENRQRQLGHAGIGTYSRREGNLGEDISNILHNISNISNNSQVSAFVAAKSSKALPKEMLFKNSDKKNSAKKQREESQDNISANKENNNTSNSIRVIQEEGFDFEKWARENELHISGFQL